MSSFNSMPVTKLTDVQNQFALSYHGVCGLYFVAVIFAVTIAITISKYIYVVLDDCTCLISSVCIYSRF